jgi:hypothetical protein
MRVTREDVPAFLYLLPRICIFSDHYDVLNPNIVLSSKILLRLGKNETAAMCAHERQY